MSDERGWSLLPGFLIRSTGFPIELLDSLRMPESLDHAERVQALDQQVNDLSVDFNGTLFPFVIEMEQQNKASKEVFESWYKLNRCVHKKRPCADELYSTLVKRWSRIGSWIEHWNMSLSQANTQREFFSQRFSTEFQLVRQRLYDIVQQDQFQEAILLSNPNIHAIAFPSYTRHYNLQERNAKIRHLERRFYAYLQRFCAKNDTTSFFGPIDYGWYDEYATTTSSQQLRFEQWNDRTISARLTRMSYWATQTLADCISRDATVQPYLVPRLQNGIALLSSGGLYLTTHRRTVHLSLQMRELLGCIDGRQRLMDLHYDNHELALQLIREMSNRGLVVLRLEVPTAEFNPLQWLYQQVEALPIECVKREEWLQCLDVFRTYIADFTAASVEKKTALLSLLEEHFRTTTKQDTRRGEGETYVDRLIIYDEAQGNVKQCVIGKDFHDQIYTQLQTTLDICASYSLLLQKVCRQKARDLFLSLGTQQSLPYLTFIHNVDKSISLEDCVAHTEVQRFLQGLTSLFQQKQDGTSSQVCRDDVSSHLLKIPSGTMISPDLFISAPSMEALLQGKFTLVVGEIHYGAQVWCHFLTFCDRKQEMQADLERLLKHKEREFISASVVHRRQQGKTFYLELPGSSVEILGRSVKPRQQVIPVADLEVSLCGDELIVFSRAQQSQIELYPGDPRGVSNWLFGTPPVIPPPIAFDSYTPRLVVDDVVFQRASWKLSTLEIQRLLKHTDEAMLMMQANLYRHQHGIPQRCFARVPSERKPFYVDFANVLSLEWLSHMLSQNDTVVFTECLPAFESWWLKKAEGTYSSEWRMTMIYQ